jgi:hypothetical protein
MRAYKTLNVLVRKSEGVSPRSAETWSAPAEALRGSCGAPRLLRFFARPGSRRTLPREHLPAPNESQRLTSEENTGEPSREPRRGRVNDSPVHAMAHVPAPI